MSQERLNYLMILHTYKESTDLLDMKVIVNEFISNSEHHNSLFAIIILIMLFYITYWLCI